MPTSYSTNLKLTLIGTGEQVGTWGDTNNINLGTLIEEAISGYTTVNFGASYAVTLTMSSGVSCDARHMCLQVTRDPTSFDLTPCTLTVPATPKLYIIKYDGVWAANAYWTASNPLSIQVSGGTSSTLVPWAYDGNADTPVPFAAMFFCDGTDLIPIMSNMANPPDIGTSNPRQVNALGGTLTVPTLIQPTITSGTMDSTIIGATTPSTGRFTRTTTKVIIEEGTTSATSATGTVIIPVNTQPVTYYTANASANWVVNLTGVSSVLTTNGYTCSVAFMVTQGTTAYYNTSVQVDGTTSGVTTKWQGGSAPTAGSASGVDVYTYTIIRTAASTYTVLASVTPFA